jgi:serine/threonine-protein kinase
MSQCSRCGAAISIGTVYCPRCGSNVAVEVSAAKTERLRRPSAESVASGEQRLLDELRSITLGDYEIQGEIGRGGMAVVFLAHELALDRKVAIKVMSPALTLMDTGIQERFKREARTAASLSHPHIIPVYAVKESGDLVYFVMKYIVGRSLESVIHEIGRVPIPIAQTILNQAGSALGHAHRRGVVHRDVKPGNIMLDEDGWVVVTDFGIAKVAEAEALTMTGGMVGTPAYMSPEQCSAQPVTGASDQYSLGIVAYEMLTGHVPFESGTMVSVLYDHCHTPPAPIEESRPDCPPALAQAIMRMLAKHPGERFPTIDDAAVAIGVVSDSKGGTVRTQLLTLARRHSTQQLLEKFTTPKSPIPSTQVSRPAVARGSRPAAGASARAKSRWTWWWLLPGAAVAAVAGWFALAPRGPAAPPEPAAPDTASLVVSLPATAGRSDTGPSRGAGAAPTPETPGGNTVAAPPRTRQAPPVTTVRESAPVGAPAAPTAAVGTTAAIAQADDSSVRDSTPPPRQPNQGPPAPTGVQRAADAPAPRDSVRDSSAATLPVGGRAEPQRPPSPPPDSGRPLLPTPAEDRAAVSRLLESYRAAIEARDLARLRAAYPGLTADQERAWRQFFSNVETLRARFDVLDIEIAGDRARARVRATQEYRAQRDEHQTFEFTATFQRLPDGWRLTFIE